MGKFLKNKNMYDLQKKFVECGSTYFPEPECSLAKKCFSGSFLAADLIFTYVLRPKLKAEI